MRQNMKGRREGIRLSGVKMFQAEPTARAKALRSDFSTRKTAAK